MVVWAIQGKSPLCGQFAQIEFDDAEGNTVTPSSCKSALHLGLHRHQRYGSFA